MISRRLRDETGATRFRRSQFAEMESDSEDQPQDNGLLYVQPPSPMCAEDDACEMISPDLQGAEKGDLGEEHDVPSYDMTGIVMAPEDPVHQQQPHNLVHSDLDDTGELDYEPSEPENSLKNDGSLSEGEEPDEDDGTTDKNTRRKGEPNKLKNHAGDEEEDEGGITGSDDDDDDDGQLAKRPAVVRHDGDEEEDDDNDASTNDGRDLEDGEIDELEDGEVKDDDDDVNDRRRYVERRERPKNDYRPALNRRSPPRLPPRINDIAKPEDVGICKFFMRGQCTWANFCKFLHPGYSSGDRGSSHQPPPIIKADTLPPLMSQKTPALTSIGIPTMYTTLNLQRDPPPATPQMVQQQPSNNYPNFSDSLIQPTTVYQQQMCDPINIFNHQPPSMTMAAPPRMSESKSMMPSRALPPVPRVLPPPPVPPAVVLTPVLAAQVNRPAESAWERGLKQAREMMKKAEKKHDGIVIGSENSISEQAPVAEEAEAQKGFPFLDTRRYYNRQGHEQRRNMIISSHQATSAVGAAGLAADDKNSKPTLYQRTSFEAKEWRDPWMRSSGGASQPPAAAATDLNSKRASSSVGRKRRRSYSDSSSKSSFSSSSRSRSSRRRRRSGSGSSAERAGNDEAGGSRADRRSEDRSSRSGSRSRRSRSRSKSSSGSSENARRRNARSKIGSRKIKKMDEGRHSSAESQKSGASSVSGEHHESPFEIDDFNQTSSLGFDIKNLVTKKELSDSPRKPIKLTISSKSRVQVPAAYNMSPRRRKLRPLPFKETTDDRRNNDDEDGEQNRPVSPGSPSDLPSDDDAAKQGWSQPVGNDELVLENIESSDEDLDDRPMMSEEERRSEVSNNGSGAREWSRAGSETPCAAQPVSEQDEDETEKQHNEQKEDISDDDEEDDEAASSGSSSGSSTSSVVDQEETVEKLNDDDAAGAEKMDCSKPADEQQLHPSVENDGTVVKNKGPLPNVEQDSRPAAPFAVNAEATTLPCKPTTAEGSTVPTSTKSAVTSRREELLRQLRAVEEAIAKKRSNKQSTKAQ